ncbi:hypothetical protein M378DRAFT_172699 [Amanita muscaria Koide BX008]|uniref:Uncharacterized protein n=1 Tax=Amanita muscaria (strain Koide BX008) TaxID=946122 RepID=A0A0C2W5N4_AMAMK|nr:hypothetical protein M378DRAFT_172699 [Amanita muscaria Koide BX008]
MACKVSRRENVKKAFIAVFADGVGTLQYVMFYRLKAIGVEIWIIAYIDIMVWCMSTNLKYDMTGLETGSDANGFCASPWFHDMIRRAKHFRSGNQRNCGASMVAPMVKTR